MRYYTSEQVGIGHPDKVADQISDAILTHLLAKNKKARVAVETLVKDSTIVLAGEISDVELEENELENIAKSKWLSLVKNDGHVEVINLLSKQSLDIAQGVDHGGAGDQGIMFGYATNETPQKLPLAYVLATEALVILNNIASSTNANMGVYNKHLHLDSKAQVTLVEDGNGNKKIDTFLISVQHDDELPLEDVKNCVKNVMETVAIKYNMNTDFKVLVNPTGRFEVGGPYGDAGVTGRKIIADTYGGYALHGGGAFSGKDPSKVDRSAAYMARFLAKWALGHYNLEDCTIQLAYAIGIPQPLSINVYSNTMKWMDAKIEKDIENYFDLTPKGIIEFLDLLNVDYNKVSKYGHFTDQSMPWEVMV